MNEDKKNLLEANLYLKYYKKDITDRYDVILDRLVLDNDILNNYEYLWVSPLSKHQKIQQENKQLKEELYKYKEAIAKFKDLKTLIGILNNNNLRFIFNEILQELEKGDNSNE